MKDNLYLLFGITGIFFLTAALSAFLGNWLESSRVFPEKIGFGIVMVISWGITWAGVFFYLKKKKIL